MELLIGNASTQRFALDFYLTTATKHYHDYEKKKKNMSMAIYIPWPDSKVR